MGLTFNYDFFSLFPRKFSSLKPLFLFTELIFLIASPRTKESLKVKARKDKSEAVVNPVTPD